VGGGISCQFDLFALLFEVAGNVVNFVVGSRFLHGPEVREVNQFGKLFGGTVLLSLGYLPLHHNLVIVVEADS
jgi:hypothetical protein